MDKSVDNNINQLHPSKILDEMGISWNDDIEKKTSSLYKKVASVIPGIADHDAVLCTMDFPLPGAYAHRTAGTDRMISSRLRLSMQLSHVPKS